MAQLQYMPGDPRLVDQLVCELKSKGIFDQFRKECIADVDTRPAYQNLRQRVENSVSTFLSRQCWKPDLNKNQLREKLRKHILDGNYLEQGVERIVDQVVNPKVASVFIPQVEDLVYNYLGISRKKSVTTMETSNEKINTVDLLPTDLEAVSPGSVKSNDDKAEVMESDIIEDNNMYVEETKEVKLESEPETTKEEIKLSSPIIIDSDSSDDKNKAVPMEDIKLENIPPPDNSPPKFDLAKIENQTEIPHPDQIPLPNFPKDPTSDKDMYFKHLHSEDDSSSESSLRRNMSPLTPIRNYNNENSCDAQQAFDNDSDSKSNDKNELNTFRFTIDAKSSENNDITKVDNKDSDHANLSYQFSNQVNLNTFTTPLYEDSSNSNNLHIDYESDANSKTNNIDKPAEQNEQNSQDYKKDKKYDDKKNSSKSQNISHRSRDSHRHSSHKQKRSDSKQSSSRDSSKHDKKSKDDHGKSKSSHREREKSKDRSDKKDNRDSKHRSSSHKSSGSSNKDSKTHKSSTSSQRHSTDKSDKRSSEDKRTSSSHKDKSEKSNDRNSRDKKDSKSNSHRSDKDKKSKNKHDDKDKKKNKKDTDDHYSLSGRGNHNRRSTDRDSNDGSSSSKGSQNHSCSKSAGNKREGKGTSSKSESTSTSGESTSPVDKEQKITAASDIINSQKPIRVDNHLEIPITSPPRLPFVPDITLKKPKFAANLEEAKRKMKMRKFLDEEQKRMNQEAALLLEFQANVRPSLSQVYSSISGPELEFACISSNNSVTGTEPQLVLDSNTTVVTDGTQIVNGIEETTKFEAESVTNFIADEEKKTNMYKNKTYSENKPFYQLMNEISKRKKEDVRIDNLPKEESKKRTEFFEVTIITEELSETDEPELREQDTDTKTKCDINTEEPVSIESVNNKKTALKHFDQNENTERSTLMGDQDIEMPVLIENKNIDRPVLNENKCAKSCFLLENETVTKSEAEFNEKNSLKYFAEHEKFEAELKTHQYSEFVKKITQESTSNKVYIMNCDTYEENIIKEVYSRYGNYEIINYYKNGYLKLLKTNKTVIRNVNLASEITLPLDSKSLFRSNERSKSLDRSKTRSPVFSPVKSECSFELSSDYDAKLEEMVNKTSRQEVMEIILGSAIQNDNPTIDYCMESSIESNTNLKRQFDDVECGLNNNRQILTKIRKLSDSDLISSTTEESEEISNNNKVSSAPRSKYLGRARRVGLPRPKRSNQPNSPSSDKSVENYEQNTPFTPQTPNGKIKAAPRNKVQRYEKTDLYKPKLHYLSRRNNIT